MSEDAGRPMHFLCALFVTVMKPIFDLRLLISGLCVLPFALSFSGAMLLALCLPAHAQQQPGKGPRIGFITASVSFNPARNEAFRQSLRDLGYVEGETIVIEWRADEGKRNRQRAIAAELVRLKVDVIVTVSSAQTRAAREASATIPIVMTTASDPVASGLVSSLARPGGNVTGLSTLTPEISGKRLELLKEVVPTLTRVAVFASSSSLEGAQVLK
jgi:putative ABC transport system substrate-binding protein